MAVISKVEPLGNDSLGHPGLFLDHHLGDLVRLHVSANFGHQVLVRLLVAALAGHPTTPLPDPPPRLVLHSCLIHVSTEGGRGKIC